MIAEEKREGFTKGHARHSSMPSFTRKTLNTKSSVETIGEFLPTPVQDSFIQTSHTNFFSQSSSDFLESTIISSLQESLSKPTITSSSQNDSKWFSSMRRKRGKSGVSMEEVETRTKREDEKKGKEEKKGRERRMGEEEERLFETVQVYENQTWSLWRGWTDINEKEIEEELQVPLKKCRVWVGEWAIFIDPNLTDSKGWQVFPLLFSFLLLSSF